MVGSDGTVVGVAVLLHVRSGEEFAHVVTVLEDVLGLRRVRGWDGGTSTGVVLRAADGTDVEVVGPPGGGTWARGSQDVQLSLLVRGIEAWWHRLSADTRVEVAEPLGERPFGVRSFALTLTPAIALYVVERLPGNPARRQLGRG